MIIELSLEGFSVKILIEISSIGKSVSRKSLVGYLGSGDRIGVEFGGEVENGESFSVGRESRGFFRETDRYRYFG